MTQVTLGRDHKVEGFTVHSHVQAKLATLSLSSKSDVPNGNIAWEVVGILEILCSESA